MKLFREKEWPRQRKTLWLGLVRQSQEAHGENFPIGRGWEKHEDCDHWISGMSAMPNWGKIKKKRKRKRRRRRKRRGTTQRQQHGQPVLMKSFQDLSQHSVGSLFWMPLWLNILQERRKWVICSQPESPVLPKCGVTVCKALPDRLLNETPSTRPIHITW